MHQWILSRTSGFTQVFQGFRVYHFHPTCTASMSNLSQTDTSGYESRDAQSLEAENGPRFQTLHRQNAKPRGRFALGCAGCSGQSPTWERRPQGLCRAHGRQHAPGEASGAATACATGRCNKPNPCSTTSRHFTTHTVCSAHCKLSLRNLSSSCSAHLASTTDPANILFFRCAFICFYRR